MVHLTQEAKRVDDFPRKEASGRGREKERERERVTERERVIEREREREPFFRRLYLSYLALDEVETTVQPLSDGPISQTQTISCNCLGIIPGIWYHPNPQVASRM
jgi:hypothetical protein